MRLRYLDSPHRGRKVGPRAHPVPDLEEIVLQIGLELVEGLAVHSRGTLVGRKHSRPIKKPSPSKVAARILAGVVVSSSKGLNADRGSVSPPRTLGRGETAAESGRNVWLGGFSYARSDRRSFGGACDM